MISATLAEEESVEPCRLQVSKAVEQHYTTNLSLQAHTDIG